MKNSIKLALRASEIRQKVNELPVDDAEKRSALLSELSTIETEFRAALTAEAAEDNAAPSGEGLSAEERERRQLENRAELRQALHAVMNERALSGAEAELQQAVGLSGHAIPWELLAPRHLDAGRAEHRADAVSGAPADTHLMQHSIIGRVFARSATMALGVAMPAVPVGQQNFPVISAGSDASVLAKDASVGDAGAATLTAHTISPTRLQVEYIFRREDQATLMGIEEALRRDLSGTLSEQLDKQVLVGGATPNFGGFLSTPGQGGLAARADTPAIVDFGLAAAELALGLDGKYAGELSEVCSVVGTATARKLATVFQTNDSDSAWSYSSRFSKKTMASANVPAAAATFQEGVLARVGGEGMNAVCPVWSGVAMVRDEVSQALRKKGQISITAIMMAGFDVLRAEGFARTKFKVSA